MTCTDSDGPLPFLLTVLAESAIRNSHQMAQTGLLTCTDSNGRSPFSLIVLAELWVGHCDRWFEPQARLVVVRGQ